MTDDEVRKCFRYYKLDLSSKMKFADLCNLIELMKRTVGINVIVNSEEHISENLLGHTIDYMYTERNTLLDIIMHNCYPKNERYKFIQKIFSEGFDSNLINIQQYSK